MTQDMYDDGCGIDGGEESYSRRGRRMLDRWVLLVPSYQLLLIRGYMIVIELISRSILGLKLESECDVYYDG